MAARPSLCITALLALTGCHGSKADMPSAASTDAELVAFVREVETQCGVPPGTAVVSEGSRILIGASRTRDVTYGEFMCVMNELDPSAPQMRGVRVDIAVHGP